MAGIDAIGPIYGGASGGMSAGQIAPASNQGQLAQAGAIGSQASSSILSLSSTSITASSETLMASNTPMLATNEAIGAALLMLILEYLQTSDAKQKQDLAGMIVALASMQQPSGGAGQSLFYSSSSLSIESTQLTMATSQGFNAYSGAAAQLQQAPQADGAAANLDVTA